MSGKLSCFSPQITGLFQDFSSPFHEIAQFCPKMLTMSVTFDLYKVHNIHIWYAYYLGQALSYDIIVDPHVTLTLTPSSSS